MGLLFIFLLGISAIILIAKLASKTRPKEERISGSGEEKGGANGRGHYPEKQLQDKSTLEESLIALLIKKGVITEEELLSEVELIRKFKEGH
jgi:hypothetical protein